MTEPSEEARKFDSDKARMDLLPALPVIEIAEVFAFGAKKYSDYNYLGLKRSRIYAAALRHMFAWFTGDEVDEETGKSHLAHAACCILMLRHCEYENSGEDDRRQNKPKD